MSRPKIGKQRAVFPPGYVVPSPLRALFSVRSARLRAFVFGLVFGLRPSRFRTYLMAHGAHWAYGELSAGRLDRALDTTAEECEWVTLGALETFRGRDACREGWRWFSEAFPGVQLELHEYIDAPGGRFVCLHSFEGEGATSGIRTAELGPGVPIQCVYTIRHGMIIRIETFTSKAEALEAAGLSE